MILAALPSPSAGKKKKKKYRCPHYPRVFARSDACHDHKAKVHGDGKLPICHECNPWQDFASMKSLKEHQKIQYKGVCKHRCPYVVTYSCKF